ncbi:MAG: glycerophosphodiester phosphodiesterase [Clostridia bacterium]|nr:glycerophosphodiester phosphodiesterase [Clostridia bacterium]
MNIKSTRLFTTPIAHRGLHNDEIPENSLLSYEKAIEKGYPIEIDVRIIDDGTIIVFHDDTLGRMTDKDGYASGLRETDLPQLYLKGTDQTVPTFKQVLDLVHGEVPLLIETKVTAKIGALESKVIELLKEYKGEYAMQSFDPYSMEYFRKHTPDTLRGQLSATFTKTSGLSLGKRIAMSHLSVTKISDPHFISFCGADLPNKYVAKKQLPTLAWTIRSKTDYEKVADYCDNIIFEGFSPENE